MSTISGIPPEEVGRVVQDFVNDGARQVVAELAPDGTYTVTAPVEAVD